MPEISTEQLAWLQHKINSRMNSIHNLVGLVDKLVKENVGLKEIVNRCASSVDFVIGQTHEGDALNEMAALYELLVEKKVITNANQG
jgi:hypothetical protein